MKAEGTSSTELELGQVSTSSEKQPLHLEQSSHLSSHRMSHQEDAVIVIFSKMQVRHRKLAHFLKQYGPSALPDGPELAAMMGTFQFFVDGWNDDPQELYAIPEIRKFYQEFHQKWPYWFFFCDLTTETLSMMTLCLLPNIQGFKRLGEPTAAAEYDPLDLVRFIEKNFAPLNTMMERAGMSEMDIYHRTRDIFRYFNLPFDAPPPETMA